MRELRINVRPTGRNGDGLRDRSLKSHSVAQHDTQEGVFTLKAPRLFLRCATLIEQTCETCAYTVALRTTQGVLS